MAPETGTALLILGLFVLPGFVTLLLRERMFVVATIGLRWRSSRRIRSSVLGFVGVSPSHGVSSAWNEAFGREGLAMLRVTLKDGRVVGGYFGDGSLAGYSEHSQDLFISERWSIDPENDWFTGMARGTMGLWVARDEIASIEFYERPRDEADNVQTPPGQGLA